MRISDWSSDVCSSDLRPYNARRPVAVRIALKKSDFHYDLPAELIAQAPLPERSASRLLVVPPGEAGFDDRHVRDLPALLREGDLLVFNDTRDRKSTRLNSSH